MHKVSDDLTVFQKKMKKLFHPVDRFKFKLNNRKRKMENETQHPRYHFSFCTTATDIWNTLIIRARTFRSLTFYGNHSGIFTFLTTVSSRTTLKLHVERSNCKLVEQVDEAINLSQRYACTCILIKSCHSVRT